MHVGNNYIINVNRPKFCLTISMSYLETLNKAKLTFNLWEKLQETHPVKVDSWCFALDRGVEVQQRFMQGFSLHLLSDFVPTIRIVNTKVDQNSIVRLSDIFDPKFDFRNWFCAPENLYFDI